MIANAIQKLMCLLGYKLHEGFNASLGGGGGIISAQRE
jgi:hypothetical protein